MRVTAFRLNQTLLFTNKNEHCRRKPTRITNDNKSITHMKLNSLLWLPFFLGFGLCGEQLKQVRYIQTLAVQTS